MHINSSTRRTKIEPLLEYHNFSTDHSINQVNNVLETEVFPF